MTGIRPGRRPRSTGAAPARARRRRGRRRRPRSGRATPRTWTGRRLDRARRIVLLASGDAQHCVVGGRQPSSAGHEPAALPDRVGGRGEPAATIGRPAGTLPASRARPARGPGDRSRVPGAGMRLRRGANRVAIPALGTRWCAEARTARLPPGHPPDGNARREGHGQRTGRISRRVAGRVGSDRRDDVYGTRQSGASPLAPFGAESRHYRTAGGLSQEQLGDWIGDRPLVGAVEDGARMPTRTSPPPRRARSGHRGGPPGLWAHLRDRCTGRSGRRGSGSGQHRARSRRRSWSWAVSRMRQTEAYARRVLRGALADATDEEVEQQASAGRSGSRSCFDRTRRCSGQSWTKGRHGAGSKAGGHARAMGHVIEASKPEDQGAGRASCPAQRRAVRAFGIAEFGTHPTWCTWRWRRRADRRRPGDREACGAGLRYSASRGRRRGLADLIDEVKDTWT